jgi:hypothetical protein
METLEKLQLRKELNDVIKKQTMICRYRSIQLFFGLDRSRGRSRLANETVHLNSIDRTISDLCGCFRVVLCVSLSMVPSKLCCEPLSSNMLGCRDFGCF